MDLKFSGAEPLAEERDAVDRLLGSGESGWHGGERDEHGRGKKRRDARNAHSENLAPTRACRPVFRPRMNGTGASPSA